METANKETTYLVLCMLLKALCTLLHVDHTITYFTFAGMFIPWNCNRPSILRFQSGRKFTFTHLKNKNTNKNISEIRTFTDFYGPRSEIRTNTDQYGLVRILRTSWPPCLPPCSNSMFSLINYQKRYYSKT